MTSQESSRDWLPVHTRRTRPSCVEQSERIIALFRLFIVEIDLLLSFYFRIISLILENIITTQNSNMSTPLKCLLIAISLVISMTVVRTKELVTTEEFICNSSLALPRDVSMGTIKVDRINGGCRFENPFDPDSFLAIQLDDLLLYKNESLSVHTVKKTVFYYPPFDAGYLIVGLANPSFELSLTPQNNSFNLRFYQHKNFLNLTTLKNVKFNLVPVGLSELDLSIDNSYGLTTHIQLKGAKFETELHDYVVPSDKLQANLKIQSFDNNSVQLETSTALGSCSNFHQMFKEDSNIIIGPNATELRNSYKCVNIYNFNHSLIGGHFEVDLKSFQLIDIDDSLLLDDGFVTSKVDRSNYNQYNSSILLTRSKKLVLIYESKFMNPISSQMKIYVNSVLYGGVLNMNQKELNFPKNVHTIRFQISKGYEVIAKPKCKLPTNSLLSIRKGNKLLGQFSSYIPPFIAANDADIMLDFLFNPNTTIDNCFSVSNSTLNCHMIVDEEYDTLQFGPNCVKSNMLIGSKLAYKELTFLSGSMQKFCINITSLQDYKFTRNCYQPNSLGLPKLIIDQASIDIDGSQMLTQVRALNLRKNMNLNAEPLVNITSLGFQTSYPVSTINQTYTLKIPTNLKYLAIPDKIDIRNGESIKINGLEMRLYEDMIINGTAAVINITRPELPIDFGTRKGFNIVLKKYDDILEASQNQTQIVVPKDAKSAIVKIKTTLMQRIQFQISNPAALKAIYDGQSTKHNQIPIPISTNGTSTSNNVILEFQSDKPLGPIKINYNFANFNSTTDFKCDNNTRFIPPSKLCTGEYYCLDGKDLLLNCSGVFTPGKPRIVEVGYSGTTLFFLSLFMITLGVMGSLYGPGVFRVIEERVRSGRYSSFTSVE